MKVQNLIAKYEAKQDLLKKRLETTDSLQEELLAHQQLVDNQLFIYDLELLIQYEIEVFRDDSK